MEQEKIRELLSRYYEGQTSEEEEAALKEYFGKAGLPEDLIAYGYLLYASGEIVPEPSSDFITRLGSITGTGTHFFRKRTLRLLLTAASLALIVATYFILSDIRSSSVNDTYSDPEAALAEVRSVLFTVSNNMKAGTTPLNSIKTMSLAPKAINDLGKMNKTVNENIGKLRYLNKLEALSEKSKNNQ